MFPQLLWILDSCFYLGERLFLGTQLQQSAVELEGKVVLLVFTIVAGRRIRGVRQKEGGPGFIEESTLLRSFGGSVAAPRFCWMVAFVVDYIPGSVGGLPVAVSVWGYWNTGATIHVTAPAPKINALQILRSSSQFAVATPMT